VRQGNHSRQGYCRRDTMSRIARDIAIVG
jgi:hypothetical protein